MTALPILRSIRLPNPGHWQLEKETLYLIRDSHFTHVPTLPGFSNGTAWQRRGVHEDPGASAGHSAQGRGEWPRPDARQTPERSPIQAWVSL